MIETVEMLTLDALNGAAPTLYAVLTSRDHLTRADTYDHLRQMRKAARRRWAGCEWAVQIEFQRRGALHLNLLVKGVPVEDLAEFEAVVVGRWLDRVEGAESKGQWCGELYDAGGLMKYLGKMLAHGLKREQAPPLGWKGHRFSATHGYFGQPRWKAHAEAAASLRRKREVWKAEREGHELGEALAIADARMLRAAQERWELVALSAVPVGEVVGQIDVCSVTEYRRTGEVRVTSRLVRAGTESTGELTRVRPAAGGGIRVAMRNDAARERRSQQSENVGRALRALDELRDAAPRQVLGRASVPE